MEIFNRSEDEIVFDLIDRDNPGLNPKLTPANCYITTAVPNTDSDANLYNTVATVTPRYGSGMFGKRVIKYNRIDLEALFRGVTPHVPVQGFSANTAYATREEIAVFIGETYGLPIFEGDVDASNSSLQFYPKPHAQFGKGVYKIANNKCFIGQIYVGFSRDFTESLSGLFKPNFLAALNLPVGVVNVTGHNNWPLPYSYFADSDFTEIASAVNHNSDIDIAKATLIGQHTGRVFFAPVGQYDPSRDYDHTNPFGWIGAWNKHVALDEVSKLVGQFPWLKTNYTHVKITKMDKDPATGLAPDQNYYFAFYFNWYKEV